MESEYQGWGRRFNWAIVAVVGLGIVGWLIALGMLSFWLLLAGVLFGSYVVSLVVLVEWAILHFRGRKVPDLPLIPRRLVGRRSLLIGLCLYVSTITLAREGVFAPHFVFTFGLFNTESHHEFQTHSSSMGGETGQLRSLPLKCVMDCQPSGTMCETVLSALSCANETLSDEVILVEVAINLDRDPFCYVPIFKSAEVSYDAEATITDGYSTHSLSLTGTTRLEMTGIGSCYAFRTQLGTEIAQHVGTYLNSILRP